MDNHNVTSPPRVPSVDDLVRVFDEIDRVKIGHRQTFNGKTATNICRMCKERFRYLAIVGRARHTCDNCTCADIYAAASSNKAP